MTGLVSYGTYIPHHRLDRASIGEALGGKGGRGARAVAGYDEDSVSMAVEAARAARRPLAGPDVQRLLFATTSPPYMDKTNANIVHAALGLEPAALAIDFGCSVRSAVGCLILASESVVPAMAVMADLRSGLPGGRDERESGDAAAAFVFSESPDAIAHVTATSVVTEEFLDRWRTPDAKHSSVWEERFGEHVYVPLADEVLTAVLDAAGLTRGDVDVLVVAGTHERAMRSFASMSGVRRVADDMAGTVGNCGAAQPGLLLANVLDQAQPGQTIALVVLADGATALLLQTTSAISTWRSQPSVTDQVAAEKRPVRYADYLTWRGWLTQEPPRRPDPVPPAAPPTYRSSRYKYGLIAHRCAACGTIHLPAVRVCVGCGSLDRMEEVSMADRPGTITTYTVDHLAYSPSPPVIAAVVDFEGGGRLSCELTDANPGDVAIGDRVEMSFRKIVTAGGVHNYFWKARPADRALRPSELETSI